MKAALQLAIEQAFQQAEHAMPRQGCSPREQYLLATENSLPQATSLVGAALIQPVAGTGSTFDLHQATPVFEVYIDYW